MQQTRQEVPNASGEERLFHTTNPIRRASTRIPVAGGARGYELDWNYVDNSFFRYRFYLSSEAGREVTEDIADFYGFGYVEVYIKRNGKCPERPDFVYLAGTPIEYEELVIYVSSLGDSRRQRDEDSGH